MGRYKKGELLLEQTLYKLSELIMLLKTALFQHPAIPYDCFLFLKAVMAQKAGGVLLNSPTLLRFDSYSLYSVPCLHV